MLGRGDPLHGAGECGYAPQANAPVRGKHQGFFHTKKSPGPKSCASSLLDPISANIRGLDLSGFKKARRRKPSFRYRF